MGGTSGELRNYKLKVWRQKNRDAKGFFQDIDALDISPNQSFLEMLDKVNQDQIKKGEEPITFDSDCREGICGTCALVVNGNPHGPEKNTTVCQLHMRSFASGDSITIEPFRSNSFPMIKDLSVDRHALDEIIEAGGFISVRTGNAVDANAIPVAKEQADLAFAAATCIGCGACVAACTNSSAMLFTSAKISHLAHLPQGQPEHEKRVLAMVHKMDELGFGNCSNTGACSLACPKGISLENMALMNRSFLKASIKERGNKESGGGDF